MALLGAVMPHMKNAAVPKMELGPARVRASCTRSVSLARTVPGLSYLRGQSRMLSVKSRREAALACRASSEGDDKEAWKVQLRENEARDSEDMQAVEDEIERRIEELQARQSVEVSSNGGPAKTQLSGRVAEALSLLESGLIERGTEVRLMLLAAFCGEHLLLLGPPGTAKSELGRRLSLLCKGRYFERLLTRFSVPEELFGPLSLKGLEQDEYIRAVDGYLPTADVAFVDEIFKANSAILNSLLTILNEGLFDNGNERVKVPLTCMVGASNELPESEELDALYDRFLFRRMVSQVSASGLKDLLSLDALDERAMLEASEKLISSTEMRSSSMEASTVAVPDSVVELICDLRVWLQESCAPPVYISDRRLVKSINMLKVAAWTSGRSSVSEYDCLLLQHTFWQRPEDSDKIFRWLIERIGGT